MKVDLLNSITASFSNICCGECFEYRGNIYMRIRSNHIEHDSGYGACLDTGCVLEIKNEEQVRRLRLKVVEDIDNQ